MRDPDARNGKMWASRAAAGRSGKFRLDVCMEWMVPPSGSWAVMPGIALVREWRVGSNEVSGRACVKESRGCWRGGGIICFGLRYFK
jgi:hypothetical protein